MAPLRRATRSLLGAACALLAMAVAAVPAAAAGWQPVTPPDLPGAGLSSTLLRGHAVVVGWTSSSGAIFATAFSSTRQDSVLDATSTPVAPGVTGDPVVVSTAGAGVSLAWATVHSDDRRDPLNGLAFTSRSSDGSWPAPQVVATGDTTSCGIAALLLGDGSPLLASDGTCQGVATVIHGNTFAGDAHVDHGNEAGSPSGLGYEVMDITLARDGRGHVWIAWYSAFLGVVMRQLDRTTGAPLGTEHVAPDSRSPLNGLRHVALVCTPTGSGCRVVYATFIESRIVSWAPHAGARRVLLDTHAGGTVGPYAAAYRGDGRLWVAWVAGSRFDPDSVRFMLVGPPGRRPRVGRVPLPAHAPPTQLAIQPFRGQLLLLASITTATDPASGQTQSQIWADHVARP